MPTVLVAFRCPEEFLSQIDSVVSHAGGTRTDFILDALRQSLDRADAYHPPPTSEPPSAQDAHAVQEILDDEPVEPSDPSPVPNG